MENLLKDFDVDHKNPSLEAQRRWRSAVSLVKNRRRRFRFVPDLDKRFEVEKKKQKIQEKIRVALYVQKAALQFIDAGGRNEYTLSEEAREAGFSIHPDELASIVRSHDSRALKFQGGVEGIARKVSVSLDYGVGVGIATEGWPKGMYDGLGIILSVLLVVMVTAIKVKDNKSGDIVKSEISEDALSILLQTIFQNTSCEIAKEDGKVKIFGTPTESAILEFGLLLGGDFDAQRSASKILKIEPFNSVRKKMSVLVARPDGGMQAYCKGASEIILGMCNKVVVCNGQPVHLSEEFKRNISDVINSFASEALRTLCLAFQDIDDSTNELSIPDDGYTLVAVVGIKDPVRSGVKDAVETCLAAGITVRMVTGDNINTARAIAKECGILTPDGLAIEGTEFRNLSPEQMKEIIPRIQVMARSLPLDKHKLVTNLRSMFGEVVAVTGDGTNDAPALHEADIGLAMGIAGTEVAKENADVIIMDDNFSTIVNVAKWGRAVYINIQKFVQFQLTVNVVALVLNFVSACISGSAPLTAVQLLWVNMIMDTLGALALATEPPHDGLMKRQPVARGASFITKAMWRNIIGQSIYQLVVLAILNFDGKQLLRLAGSDATDVLNTVIFNSFVFCQVFNEINSRDIEKINIFRGMFDSWVFLGVMVGTVVFQVIIVEFLGTLASTVPLSWELWLLSIIIGSISLPVAVVLKCIPVEFTAKHHDDYEALPSGPELA
ncbi:hypothetical protein FEM48_Zijuj12G0023400 [Ziziphus jujuba var. spinosa]|uniref:Calcium-transporting ATPase n=1 Tax=Ziziphus jujuba var. spinosa TaxID=714518 RepID=A0A978UAN0_ZIZJJ|nr:hypothetical protein FEM48_Zijuj12G0023400 [Ziziphus jujuba var. spinosa]